MTDDERELERARQYTKNAQEMLRRVWKRQGDINRRARAGALLGQLGFVRSGIRRLQK